MSCPRCDSPLETYRLNDRETPGCGACGYVDSAVRHELDRTEPELWEDAVERFHERQAMGRGTDVVRTTDGDHRTTE